MSMIQDIFGKKVNYLSFVFLFVCLLVYCMDFHTKNGCLEDNFCVHVCVKKVNNS